MASKSSTPSEGEIVESDSEKATKSLLSVNGTSVDRHPRKRVSVSRSPSPLPSPRRYRSRSRSHSRSPYREPRKLKRPREEDHYVHDRRQEHRSSRLYSEQRYDEERRARRSYKDLDCGERLDPDLRYDDSGPSGRSREKKLRARSPSPPRPRSKHLDYGRYEHKRIEKRTGGRSGRSDYGYAESKDRLSKEQSVCDRGYAPIATASKTRHAETRDHQTLPNDSLQLGPGNGLNPIASMGASANAEKGALQIEVPPIDEASLIEERRKRREAIKAKYKGQGTPMLVQALAQTSVSTPDSSKLDAITPISLTTHSPAASPPLTPKDTSGQESPTTFHVDKDEDLANGSAQVHGDSQEDDPVAADYDPTMDMQEDRLRYDSHHHGPDVLSKTNVEPRFAAIETARAHSPPSAPGLQSTGGEFDMFADEDDDMFAEETVRVMEVDQQEHIIQAVQVTRAKALDMSMLDDWDDEEGYYKVILGELLDDRYHVQSNVGRGMFSGVVRAMDQTRRQLVAIKIIRANDTMKKAGMKEIDILTQLAVADPDDKKHLIRLERHFEHKGHLCMVFENLSINLREVLKKFGRDVGINLKAVRAYAQQMFLGLSLLRKCNILHADLKPDNVLVNESRNTLKICDLGSASDVSENEITPYLVSRFYRAPEIILGMPYDFAIDTWSIGCTLFELYTGRILFTGRTNNQMLRSIMECRGKFSHKILRKAQFAQLHFDDLLNFRSVEKDKLSAKDVVRILNFTKPTRDLRTRLMANVKGMAEAEVKEVNLFVDLLDRCLNLNPEKRCTPNEALKHPFILRSKP